jgi:hypothetical protein
MSTKTQKTNNKGDRKGWPTIDKARPIKLSDAKKGNLYNPLTKQMSKVSLSW